MIEKTCLYCNQPLDQHESYRECLNCKFPIKGTVEDAIAKTNEKYKISFIALALMIIGPIGINALSQSTEATAMSVIVWLGIAGAIIYSKGEKLNRFFVLRKEKNNPQKHEN